MAARAILLMGPTGAGKTDLAVELAAGWPVEIISVDSALVYRGMDIGTGKPSHEILARVPHHLVDILDPSEPYSAGQFVRDAVRLMADIHARGKVPLLVGGTMLYFRALTRGMAVLPEADPPTRAGIEAEARERGWPALHADLAVVDPVAAARILVNDSQRIQRALEVFRLTGEPLSHWQRATQPPAPDVAFHRVAWGPLDRERLYERIERRFHAMMAAGFLDEVRHLFARKDLSPELPALRSVGYRQLWAHVAGNASLEEAVREGILATRHLARRQLIWLRKEPDTEWVESLDSAAPARMKAFMERIFSR
jgi:tRNA dimethylallyltransferase